MIRMVTAMTENVLAPNCNRLVVMTLLFSAQVSYTFGNKRNLAKNDAGPWVSYYNKELLFVMDASRRNDLDRADAKKSCVDMDANLVTVDRDEEFEFIKREIRRRVTLAGQELMHEQWWTAGKIRKDAWVWDTEEHRPVTVSALKRKQVPVSNDGVQLFLALSHGHDQLGWRLRGVPENYKLRYICQRDPSGGKIDRDGSSAVAASIAGVHGADASHLLYGGGAADSAASGSAVEVDEDKEEADRACVDGVQVQINIGHITHLIEDRKTICTMNDIHAEWNDVRIKWNSSLVNSSVMSLLGSYVWTPRIILYDGHVFHPDPSMQLYSLPPPILQFLAGRTDPDDFALMGDLPDMDCAGQDISLDEYMKWTLSVSNWLCRQRIHLRSIRVSRVLEATDSIAVFGYMRYMSISWAVLTSLNKPSISARRLSEMQMQTSQIMVTSSGHAKVKVTEELCSTTCEGDAFLFPFDRLRCNLDVAVTSSPGEPRLDLHLPPTLGWIQRTAPWIFDRATASDQQSTNGCRLPTSFLPPPPRRSYNSSSTSTRGSTNSTFVATAASRTSPVGSALTSSAVSFPCVRLELVMRRTLLFYVAILLSPMLILTMPLLVLLLASPGYRLKIPAMLVVILLYCLLLHFVCSLSPTGSTRVPLIAGYPLALMLISVMSACVSIVSTRRQRAASIPATADGQPRQASTGNGVGGRCCCSRERKTPPPPPLSTLTDVKKHRSMCAGHHGRCWCDSQDGVELYNCHQKFSMHDDERNQNNHHNSLTHKQNHQQQQHVRIGGQSVRLSNHDRDQTLQPLFDGEGAGTIGTLLSGDRMILRRDCDIRASAGCGGDLTTEWSTALEPFDGLASSVPSVEGGRGGGGGRVAGQLLHNAEPSVRREKSRCCRSSSAVERNVDMTLFIIVVMLLISYIIVIIYVSF